MTKATARVAPEPSQQYADLADVSQASMLVRQAMRVSPVGYWDYDESQLRIEAYLLAGKSVAVLPPMPMPIIGIQIDGRKVSFRRTGSGNSYIHPNQTVLIPPGVETRWDVGPGNTALAGAFLTGRAEVAIRRMLGNSTEPMVLNDALSVELMLQMLRVGRQDCPVGRTRNKSLTECLISHLEWLADTPPKQRGVCGTTNDAMMGRIVGLIDEGLDNALTIDSLATTANMSPSHFRKRFKESTGLTVHQFVLKMRVKRASELIAGSNMPMAAIAPECGFSNQSHMTRVLRQELGATPGELRKSLRSVRREAS